MLPVVLWYYKFVLPWLLEKQDLEKEELERVRIEEMDEEEYDTLPEEMKAMMDKRRLEAKKERLKRCVIHYVKKG